MTERKQLLRNILDCLIFKGSVVTGMEWNRIRFCVIHSSLVSVLVTVMVDQEPGTLGARQNPAGAMHTFIHT